MSAAELQALKQEVMVYLDNADERMIRIVYAMLETDAQNELYHHSLTSVQNAILVERMDKYNKGNMKFSGWEEVEGRIKSGTKNGL